MYLVLVKRLGSSVPFIRNKISKWCTLHSRLSNREFCALRRKTQLRIGVPYFVNQLGSGVTCV